MADLSVTVTPGYQFTTGEELTAAKLNLLGTPTIHASGEIGSAAIADDSVLTKHIAAAQVTDKHIETSEDDDTHRAISTNAIKDGNITTRCLATASGTADGVTYAKMQWVSATDKLLGRSTAGSGVVEEIACTAFGRSFLDDADAETGRATLELTYASRAEMEDPTTEKRVVAADAAVYHPGMAKAWCQVDGTVAVLADDAAADAANDKIQLTTAMYGAVSDGSGIWQETSGTVFGTMAAFTLYFVRKSGVSGTRYVRLYTTKAAALAGGGDYLNLDSGTAEVAVWTSEPIGASYGVDGIMPYRGLLQTLEGVYDVVFTTAFASGSYGYSLAVTDKLESYPDAIESSICAFRNSGATANRFRLITGVAYTAVPRARAFSAVFYGTLAS